MLRLLLGIILALCLLAGQALAAWLPDGSPVCAPCDEANPVVAPDGAGGVFVVWEATHIYAQHLTANGDPAPGWTATGLPVCVAPIAQGGPAVIADGQGGFFACWTDFRNNAVSEGDIYAQHVRGDGTLAPGWPVNGVPVTQQPELDNNNGALALDGGGGLFVVWSPPSPSYTVWVQHLSASGAPAAGWPSDGVVACSLLSLPPLSIISDGAGGAILAWCDGRRGATRPDGYDVYGLRLTASGSIAPGWAQNGLLLGPKGCKVRLLPDGAGGFFMAWATLTLFGFDANYYLGRFTLDGVPAPGWPAGGVVVCSAPRDRTGLMVVPDGFGGVLLTWYDYRLPGDDVYASRVLPAGTLAPGWPANGLRVSDPSQPNEFNFGLAPDGLGGAYISWENDTYTAISFIQRLTADGLVAPGWPQYGFRVASTCMQATPQLVPDGAGGAIVVWEERGGTCSRNGLFAQRYAPAGPIPTPTLLSLVNAEARDGRVALDWFAADGAGLDATVYRRTPSSGWLALGSVRADGTGHLRYEDSAVSAGERYAYRLDYLVGGIEQYTAEAWVEVPALKLALDGLRPNPAVGDLNASFTLPSAEPARLQLLDVTGRAWLAREVGSLGAGRHLVRLGGGAAVPAGMYWLRLTQSGRSLLARGVVVR